MHHRLKIVTTLIFPFVFKVHDFYMTADLPESEEEKLKHEFC